MEPEPVGHCEARLAFVGKLDAAAWAEMRDGIPDDLPRIDLPLAAPEGAGGGTQHWDDVVAHTEPLRALPSRAADSLATIVYTSGSTGTPKGVMLGFGAMAGATALRDMLRFEPDDRMLSYLPLAHVFERWIVEMGSLVSGYEIFFAESLDTFLGDLRRARPTLFISVPRLWIKFQQAVSARLPDARRARLAGVPLVGGFIDRLVRRKVLRGLGLDVVRFAGSGSAPIPAGVIAWYRSLGLELLEGYGMTENFAYSHVSRQGEVRPGYVGTPYPGVTCRIAADGEVQVKSPGNMLGYYRAPELTAASLTEDGFLRTRDTGEVDERGRLRITGRLSELFKTSKGKYVAPAPIESALLGCPHVEMACVTGAGHPRPHALVVLAEDTRAALANGGSRDDVHRALRDHLDAVNRTLDAHEALAFLCVVREPWTVENGSLTPTMKLRRPHVEATFAPFQADWYAAAAPVVWQQ